MGRVWSTFNVQSRGNTRARGSSFYDVLSKRGPATRLAIGWRCRSTERVVNLPHVVKGEGKRQAEWQLSWIERYLGYRGASGRIQFVTNLELGRDFQRRTEFENLSLVCAFRYGDPRRLMQGV